MSVIVANGDTLWCCSRCRAVYRKEFPFCPADGGEVVVATNDPLVNTEISHYTIEALLGEGAMGRVYRARHKHLADRVYAVKVLLGDLASTQEMRMRFMNEARSASKLSHRNVVTVYDVGRTDKGLLYLVMELVDGEPLSDIIARGPMDPILAANLARGICDGLAHAHAHGIVHRDLKPENVIVVRSSTGEQIPRIVDFGIAVSIDQQDSRLTATGMSMGTPGYIAPEQVSGERVAANADQYALGVTMFEMLTGGRLPFEGTPMEVAAAKTTKEAPSMSSRAPADVTIPPALEQIVARMIARKPSQRYESVVGVSRMLARWTNAPHTEVIAYPSRWPKIALAAGIAVLIGAGVGVAWTQLRADDETPSLAASTSSPPPSTDVTAVAEEDDGPDEIEDTNAPPEQRSRPKGRRASKSKKSKPRIAAAPAVEKTTAKPVEVPAPPPPAPRESAPPPPPPPPPTTLRASAPHDLTVSGALSRTDVQRALQRIEPELRRCTSSTKATAVVRFTVDNSRRPRSLRGSGVASDTLDCVISALGRARMEVAPDVGEAEVTVSIPFTSPA